MSLPISVYHSIFSSSFSSLPFHFALVIHSFIVLFLCTPLCSCFSFFLFSFFFSPLSLCFCFSPSLAPFPPTLVPFAFIAKIANPRSSPFHLYLHRISTIDTRWPHLSRDVLAHLPAGVRLSHRDCRAHVPPRQRPRVCHDALLALRRRLCRPPHREDH